jgi:MOSC domain-containing protein YiiM
MDPVVLAIFVVPSAAAPMVEVAEARAEPGRGLEGDRYFGAAGTYSRTGGSGRAVTLIEIEALEAAAREYHVDIPPALTRRNLLVRGVYLNHLVGRELTVGGVRLVGTRLCEPCGHMEELAGVKGARKALVHRGGLRCDIVSGGVVRRGDAVTAR